MKHTNMRIHVIVENLIRENGALAISAYETFEAAEAAMLRLAKSDSKTGIYRYVYVEDERHVNIFRVSDDKLVYQFWINSIELRK